MSGRIKRGIAIENKPAPLENSKRTLASLAAEVRFADGLSGLDEGESDSLSICGMGGESISRILRTHPERVAPIVLCQPNRRTELVRQWAWDAGYDLSGEWIVPGKRTFEVLRFVRGHGDPDPIYTGLDHETAILFGPHHLRHRHPEFLAQLKSDRSYLSQLKQHTDKTAKQLAAIERVLRGQP